MPNLLPIVMRKTNEQGLDLTFSQMKKSARRFEKRCEGWLLEDAEAYVMQHSDITGETAVKNVQQERNEASAARRVAVAA
ncbi:hypothetical protein [Arthrobacter sp. PsM3]|uniref:hypothetical protein n=1 Tax=Arthrobacter sp. PsM3 TaxID=3030531 RepID=UPI00263A83BC|nr:hypothetical protein [Arthrobacter sp. PsM3]MDN4644974.1 hypothetical protein [Arthrobacter sp. PsM3]